jgi:biopolymer transport protein ExbB
LITKQLLSVSLLGTEWIIYLLIALSIVSWAIMIEKIVHLLRKRGNVELLNSKVKKLIEQQDLLKASQILREDKSSLATVASKCLLHASRNDSNIEEYMTVVLSEEKLQLENRIAVLGTIVTTAPFVGLLGTVLGIINAFHGLSVNKQGGDIVMSGISEALVATALGLFIAIPAAAAYNYFIRMIKKIMVSSENYTRFLLISANKKI